MLPKFVWCLGLYCYILGFDALSSDNVNCQNTLKEAGQVVAELALFGFPPETASRFLADDDLRAKLSGGASFIQWLKQDQGPFFDFLADQLARGHPPEDALAAACSREGTTLPAQSRAILLAALERIVQRREKIQFRDERHDSFLKTLDPKTKKEKGFEMLLPDVKSVVAHLPVHPPSEEALRELVVRHRVSLPGKGGARYSRLVEQAVRAQMNPFCTGKRLRGDVYAGLQGMVFLKAQICREEAQARRPKLQEVEEEPPYLDLQREWGFRTGILLYSVTNRHGIRLLHFIDGLPQEESASVMAIIQRLLAGEEMERLIHTHHVTRLSHVGFYEIRPLKGNSPNRIFFGEFGGKCYFMEGRRVKGSATKQRRIIEELKPLWNSFMKSKKG